MKRTAYAAGFSAASTRYTEPLPVPSFAATAFMLSACIIPELCAVNPVRKGTPMRTKYDVASECRFRWDGSPDTGSVWAV